MFMVTPARSVEGATLVLHCHAKACVCGHTMPDGQVCRPTAIKHGDGLHEELLRSNLVSIEDTDEL